MASRLYPKRTKMRSPFRNLASLGLFLAVVIVATLGSFRVNGQKSLCNQWKDGDVRLLAIGGIGSRNQVKGDKLVILDTHFNGFEVEYAMLNFTSRSLNLTDAQPFNLDAAKSQFKSAHGSGKGFFIYQESHADPRDRTYIFQGDGLGYFTPDKLTIVPLKDSGMVKYFKVEQAISGPIIALADSIGIITFPDDKVPRMEIRRLAFHESKVNFTERYISSGYPYVDVMTSLTTESGIGSDGNYIAINNQEKVMNIFDRYKEVKVPVSNFFICLAEETGFLKALMTREGLFIVAMVVIVVVVIGIVASLLLSKANKLATKTLVKQRRGKAKKRNQANTPRATPTDISRSGSRTSPYDKKGSSKG